MIEKVKPILFSTPMVQAILAGRKTQTRRVAKVPEYAYYKQGGLVWHDTEQNQETKRCPRYQTGDVLWVRETWCELYDLDGNDQIIDETGKYYYAADDPTFPYERFLRDNGTFKDYPAWRPSIFMPKGAARLFLRVTDVRAERLQDITVEDCIAEGIECDNEINNPDPATHESIRTWNFSYAQFLYKELWDSLNAKRDGGKYAWAINPWVWVYTFERCRKPENLEVNKQ